MASPQRSPLGIIFLTVFVDLIGFSIIFPLFPAMLRYYIPREEGAGLLGGALELVRSLSGTDSEVKEAVLFGGLLGSLYSLCQFLFAPFWGRLSDRHGRRPILLITVAGVAASYLLWIVSGSFTLLVAARLLGGMMSGNLSVATAAIADSTTPQNRAKGMAVIGVAFGLGFILGPAIGGGLSQLDLTQHAPGLTRFGVNPFSAAALGAFLLSAFNYFWVASRFAETLRPEDRGKAQASGRTISLRRLFHRVAFPGVNRANLIWFNYLLAFSAMEFTLVFLVADRFEYTPRQNAYMFVFVGLIAAFIQGGLIRKLAPVYGEKKLAIAGLAMVIPGFITIGFAPRPGDLYLGLALMAAGSALITPSVSALVSLYAPSDQQGGVLGVFRSLGALARAVGPIAGSLFYWRFSSQAAYAAAACLCLLPLLLAWGLPAPPKEVAAAVATPSSASPPR